MARAGTKVVEAPQDGVGYHERIVLEEKVFVFIHSLGAKNRYVTIRHRLQQMHLFLLAVFLLWLILCTLACTLMAKKVLGYIIWHPIQGRAPLQAVTVSLR